MSDHVDTSSLNGDWDQLSRCSVESISEEMTVREEKMKELMEKIAKMEEENRKRDENIKLKDEQLNAKDQEIAKLKKENRREDIFTIEERMKAANEDIRISSEKLNKKTMTMYKAIWAKRVNKMQSRSLDTKKISREIEKFANLCVAVSKDVKKNNEANIKKIKKALTTAKTSNFVKNKDDAEAMDAYIGVYKTEEQNAMFPKPFEIKKDGYYDVCWTYSNGEGTTWTGIPDGVERNGVKMSVGTDLSIDTKSTAGKLTQRQFELSDEGLKHQGFRFIRIE